MKQIRSNLYQVELREMISFELGKENRERCFHLVTSVGQRKKSESL